MAVIAWRRVRESSIFGSVMVHTTLSEKPLGMLGSAQRRKTCAGFNKLKLPQAAVKSISMHGNLAEFAKAPVRNMSSPPSWFQALHTSAEVGGADGVLPVGGGDDFAHEIFEATG